MNRQKLRIHFLSHDNTGESQSQAFQLPSMRTLNLAQVFWGSTRNRLRQRFTTHRNSVWPVECEEKVLKAGCGTQISKAGGSNTL